MKKADDQLLVIFGASGDLTGRKLIPSLFELYAADLLPERFAILGAARSEYSDDQFREEQRKHIREELSGRQVDELKLNGFLSLVSYFTFDSVHSVQYRELNGRMEALRKEKGIPDRVLYYLATPPLMYEKIPEFLAENQMNDASAPDGWRRIVVEKPFGTSYASAKQLNDHLKGIFNENEIYRIDHYLGKETVQNLLVLRFANGIFEPLWNRNYIHSVEISAAESLGVEERGKYYDGAGALRDMIQNHLMELMGFTAMECPAAFEADQIKAEVSKVFRSVRPFTPVDMPDRVVRGQYEGYREESHVAPDSLTETYAAVKLFIDNWRWNDVPFYLYTGKKMAEKRSEIVINFKSTPHVLFAGQCSGESCNRLIINIQPDEGITLYFGLKVPGIGYKVEQVGMNFRYDSLSGSPLPDAYERLLLDVMEGDSTLYPQSDTLEISWKLMDPVLEYWKQQGREGLYFYPPGQNGPAERCILAPEPESCPFLPK